MFAERREPARSPLAAVVSLAAHVGLVLVLGYAAYAGIVVPETNGRPPMRFVNLALPPVPVELTMPPVPPPDPPRVEEVKPPEPIATPEIEPVVIETPKPPEPPPPPKPVPPAPAKPEVNVGVFANTRPAAMATQPPRQVQAAGFETQTAVAPDLKLKPAETGLFAGNDMAARPGTDKPKGVVTGAGFDQRAAAPTPSTGRALAVTGGGFETARQAATTTPRPQQVQDSGFGAVKPAAPQQVATVPSGPPTTPVEVLSKPSPAYTAEAKAAGVQGDVVLEVEFAASGNLKVVRVVRGLGHGLDEMAMEAARHIKFKPALQSGKPVDFRANVVIVFRLS